MEKKNEMQIALNEVIKRGDVEPERLEKFLDLQFKWEDKQAERAFYAALAKFQSECPPVIKTKNASYGLKIKTNYNWAPLDEIVEHIRPYLKKTGLAYMFDIQELEEGRMNIATTIYHTDGHSITSNYQSDALNDGGTMNNSQRRKSALSYSKRASLENAFGLVTADQDDDARRALDKPLSEDQIVELNNLLESTETDLSNFCAHMKVKNLTELSEYEAKKGINLLKQKRSR